MDYGAVICGVVALVLAGTVPAAAEAQQAPPALVFDGATVVDVEQGKLLPNQRVVIVGNHVQAVGDERAVKTPTGAQVVDARGKYLIPGLWDMHVHPPVRAPDTFYPLFLANGVTGIRDAHSTASLDTLRRWRQEILAGTSVGPPRQILSGSALGELPAGVSPEYCPPDGLLPMTCVEDAAAARTAVEALKAAGADMLKMHNLPSAMYYEVAAEARRVGMPFGGHSPIVTATVDCSTMGGYTPECVLYYTKQVSDSGTGIIDHGLWYLDPTKGLRGLCWGDHDDIEQCQSLAEHLRRNGSWFTATMSAMMSGGVPFGRRANAVFRHFRERYDAYVAGTIPSLGVIEPAAGAAIDAPRDPVGGSPEPKRGSTADSLGGMYVIQRVDMPLLAATDVAPGLNPSVSPGPGFSLHAELAMYVAEGLTPAEALRTATLNPAKFLHATDSLGTVAPGKLADLVLLDADPLVNITNTTTIRAVVANGRYFDRAALDQLLTATRAEVQQEKLPAEPPSP